MKIKGCEKWEIGIKESRFLGRTAWDKNRDKDIEGGHKMFE